MRIRNLLLIPALLGLSAAALADSALKTAHADIMNAQGTKIGTAKLKAVKNGVQISAKVEGLPPAITVFTFTPSASAKARPSQRPAAISIRPARTTARTTQWILIRTSAICRI